MVCKKCGKEIRSDMRYCTKCGWDSRTLQNYGESAEEAAVDPKQIPRKITYNVDLVFVIDVTGSMDNIINIVKKNALNFYGDVMETMKKKHKVINKMRIRVIAFRDYVADREDAMLCTRFFELPKENEELRKTISSITVFGGGDAPEDGLEALGLAMCSDWDKEGMKRRQVIVVWSDAPTHPIGYGAKVPGYPQNMARNFGELTA